MFGYWDVTLPASGTLLIHLRDDVSHAADVVVASQAASEVHATVLGVLHQDHRTFRARRVEVLQLTVLLRAHCPTTTEHFNNFGSDQLHPIRSVERGNGGEFSRAPRRLLEYLDIYDGH